MVYFARIVVSPGCRLSSWRRIEKRLPARGQCQNLRLSRQIMRSICHEKAFVALCFHCVFVHDGRRYVSPLTSHNRKRTGSATPSAAPRGANASAALRAPRSASRKARKSVVVTDGDQKVLTVDNPDVLNGHEGHHVAVTGTVTGDTIHVDSVKMLVASFGM